MDYITTKYYQHGTFNATEIKIEWANYKKITFDSQENILSIFG